MAVIKKPLLSDLYIFLTAVTMLIVIGLVFIYSSSSVYALEVRGSSQYFFKKQLVGLFLGIIGLLIIRRTPLSVIKKTSPFWFFASLALTAATLFSRAGQAVHGSSRWLSIAGFSLQPSELLKIAFVLYSAQLLTKKDSPYQSGSYNLFSYLIIVALTSVILLRQPDFGMTVTIALTAFALLFVMGMPLKYVATTVATLCVAVVGLVAFKPYRLKRVMTFLNPWSDPQGSGFQIIQSLIAIGSGGFWGTGIGHSKQKFFYLPMQHTDFIFAIIAEETGFIGSVCVILLYIVVLYYGMKIAFQLKDRFASLATFGFITMINLQALINLAVTTGLVPTKGIGLPFISYGNSSLICSLCIVGFIMNAVKNNQ